MARKDLKFALNPIQWNFGREVPGDPNSNLVFRFQEPGFVDRYGDVLKSIKAAGFEATMLEVLPGETLDHYEQILGEAGLVAAPGYLQVSLPSAHGKSLERGTPEWDEWFAVTRQRAEESKRLGLNSVVISAEMVLTDGAVRWNDAAAVGADPSQERLDELVEQLVVVCEILNAEGIRPGFHNHVGSIVETEDEIDYIMSKVDNSLMGASFDVGHLEWAGIDSVKMIEKYADRMVDLHFKDLNLEVAAESRKNPTSYMRTMNKDLIQEPGLGNLDAAGALDALPDDFDGWIIIEVDLPTMDPDESARVTAQWVRDFRGA